MNAEQLLKHFERICEAPDAIPRLRRFILDLAVRGKLVPQDSRDEPAAELLKGIAAEKARLVKAGEIRRPKEYEPIRDDECPISLPRNWAWSRLCDIGKLAGGMTPSMSRSDFWGGDVVWLSPKDIKADEIYDSELKISPLGLSETRLELYRPGCLFIVARSGILKRTFPVSINRIAAAANQDMKVLVPFLEGAERYLQIMFRGLTDFLLRDLVKTGTTVQSLKYAEFEQQPFPLPPLAEQHRIVAKVDELMKLCDQLEAAKAERDKCRDSLAAASLQGLNQPAEEEDTFREHARFTFNNLPRITTRAAHIKQLRQTILNLAVRGKLVEQEPEHESASELLKLIESEKTLLARQGLIKKVSRTEALAYEDEPFEVPVNWRWVRLGDILLKLTDGTHHSPPNGPEGDFKYITAKNIKPDGLALNDVTYVSREVHEEIYSRCNPVKGDILYIKDGATTGVATVNNLEEPFSMLSSVALLKVPQCILSELIVLFLRSPFFYGQMRGFMKGAAITRVTLKRMTPALLPLPPLAEQHRIVAKVDELMAICDQLEAQITVTEQDSRRFLESVLAEALSLGGNLSAEAQVV
jgi:type I restriction enzyme S subunit